MKSQHFKITTPQFCKIQFYYNSYFSLTGFSIEGPSQAKIDCKDNGDGSADVTYFPVAPGEYAVHILCNDQDIPNSPYMVQIQPATSVWAGKVITTV